MGKLTKSEYLKHLTDIRLKLSDFVEKVDNGNETYLVDCALKLRILFIDKSGTKALFHTIENLFGLRAFVWVTPSFMDAIRDGTLPSSLLNGMSFSYFNGCGMWFSQNKKSELKGLRDAFNQESQIVVSGMEFSVREIVETVADKMGGAHVYKSLSVRNRAPHTKDILLNGLTPADSGIYEVTVATIRVIDEILKYLETQAESEFVKPGTPN